MAGNYTPDDSMGKRLKKLRVDFGFTQEDVASRLGISQQMYSKYERANCAIDGDMIKKICNLYGISADYLLGIEKSAEVTKLSAYMEEEYINTIANRVINIIKNGDK